MLEQTARVTTLLHAWEVINCLAEQDSLGAEQL